MPGPRFILSDLGERASWLQQTVQTERSIWTPAFAGGRPDYFGAAGGGLSKLPAAPGNTVGLSQPSGLTDETPKK